jgi:hypothetical protein
VITIMAGAQDPGGAEALAPVLLCLDKADDVRLEVLARAQGGAVFQRDGLAFEAADHTPDEEVLDRIHNTAPNLVITATSQEGTLERTMIAAARSVSAPTLAILDSWTNYQTRFAEAGFDLSTRLPDVIAVPDALAKNEMCTAGLPAQKLEITGQPAFDALSRRIMANDGNIRAKIRSQLTLSEDELLVVFFSQPIRHMYGDPYGGTGRGYDEYDAICCLAEALTALEFRVKLVVKPHPREDRDKVGNNLAKLTLPAVLMDEVDPDDLMLAADAVCGMTTIMLMRAWLAGRQIISVQPGLRGADALSLARAGHVRTAVDAHSLVARLKEAIAAGPAAPPKSTLTDGEATARVAALAMSLARPIVSFQERSEV